MGPVASVRTLIEGVHQRINAAQVVEHSGHLAVGDPATQCKSESREIGRGRKQRRSWFPAVLTVLLSIEAQHFGTGPSNPAV